MFEIKLHLMFYTTCKNKGRDRLFSRICDRMCWIDENYVHIPKTLTDLCTVCAKEVESGLGNECGRADNKKQ